MILWVAGLDRSKMKMVFRVVSCVLQNSVLLTILQSPVVESVRLLSFDSSKRFKGDIAFRWGRS